MKTSITMRLILMAGLCWISLVGQVAGTSIDWRKAKCPVCGKKFQTRVLLSTNNFGGQDADFFSRASGASPVPFYVTSCPRCRYAGYTDDFLEKRDFSDSLKKELRRQLAPAIRLDKSRSHDFMSAVDAYGQAYRAMQIRQTASWDLFLLCLHASWCVRDEKSSLWGLSEYQYNAQSHLADSLTGIIRDSIWSQAIAETEAGRRLAVQALADTAASDPLVPLAALKLLRDHGEHELALRMLPLLVNRMDSVCYDSLRDSVIASIGLERSFQQRALQYLESCLMPGDTAARKADRLYLAGELNRRLGYDSAAVYWYKLAIQHPAIDTSLLRLVEQQAALVETATFRIPPDGQ